MVDNIIEISTLQYTGTLPFAGFNSTSCSWGYSFDSTTMGKSFHDTITIGKTYPSGIGNNPNRVGVLTFSNTSSIAVTARVVNGTATVSGTIYSGHGWSTYVNYNHQGDPDNNEDGKNHIYIDIPSSVPGGGGGTLTISWTAFTPSTRTASYTVDTTTFVYDGQQHHISLSSATGCSIVTTTYGTAIDTYSQVITATNGTTQFADCYYFIENGVPVATSTQSWQIVANTDKYVRIYHNGAWGKYVPYIYHNGSWQKAVAYVYTNNQWKEVNS